MNELDAIKCAIRDVLDERSKMPSEEHRDHHDWVRLQIEKERARAELWRAVLAKSVPAIVWSAVLALSGWVWHWVTTHITWR
jgi:hypothetical protein